MWEWMFSSTRTGFYNVVFQKLGLANGQIPFLVDKTWQLPAMISIDVWKTTPFMALLLLAGLQMIPQELYEAADVDGAGKLRQFFFITLPMLRPTLAVALVFRTLDAIRVFDLFQIVLANTRYSMASFSFYTLIDSQAMGVSAASSVVIFVLISVFAVIYINLLGVEQNG
jgi:trehalose/maltose transport system permease protein